MRHRSSTLPTLTVCLLLVTVVLGLRAAGDQASAQERPHGMASSPAAPQQAASSGRDPLGADWQRQPANFSGRGLPRYADPEFLLLVRNEDTVGYEPFLTAVDLSGDGLEDLAVTRMRFETYLTFPLEVLVNNGDGGMAVTTSSLFSGPVPQVQHPSRVLTADFNGDGRLDLFVADSGYDLPPHPGYQNILVLTAPDGKLVDASSNLPQRKDMTHSACAADVDGDKDVDLYVGNIWGENDWDPYLLHNNGSGLFTVAEGSLPSLIDLNHNGYTTCAFADVDGDGAVDLILGDAGDAIANEYSTPHSEVLRNDGAGRFTRLPGALPSKDNSPFDIAHDIEAFHLDNDGHIDLLLVYERANSQGSYIQALLNKGDGTFRNETVSRLEPLVRQVWIRMLELRDLDRDSDPDLLARPWDDDDPGPILWLNDGAGHLSLVDLDFKMPSLWYTFLDLGGDGGHDLVYATYAPPEELYAIRCLDHAVYLPLVLRDQRP